MCTCNNCNEITLFKGTNGVGVSSTVNNGDGTFTIYYTNGTSYTSPDLTGPQGPVGPRGNPGVDAFKFVKEYTSVNLVGFTALVTRLELESCASVPEGCLFDGILPASCDLHVQVWVKDSGEDFWYRLFDTNHVVSIWEVDGIYDAGDIFIAFQGLSESSGTTVRIVVIA
jgi:hypothetical protein